MPCKCFAPIQVPGELKYMLELAMGTPGIQAPSMDWNCFYEFAVKNRLEPALAAAAQRAGETDPGMEPILRRKQELNVLTVRQIQTLAFLMQRFREANLRVLSMKGPLLASDLYGDPTLRYSADLDLLIPEEDFAAAKQILLDSGFREEFSVFRKTEKRRKLLDAHGEELHERFTRDDITVELHWRLSFRYAVSFEDLWQKREDRMLLGQTVPYIGREDNLFYLISHAAGHGYSRLRWLMDIRLLLGRQPQSLERLYRQMDGSNVGSLLLSTLLLMYRLPGFHMESVETALFSFRREGENVTFTYDAGIRGDAKKAMRLVRLVVPLLNSPEDPRGVRDRNVKQALPVVGKKKTPFTYFKKVLQPQEADLERFDLPDSLFFLYYLIRPFYMLFRKTKK